MEITNEIIRTDIAGYMERISQGEIKLADLPGGYLSYQKYKKREQKRRQLKGEISHIQKLMRYATEALNEHTIAGFGNKDRLGNQYRRSAIRDHRICLEAGGEPRHEVPSMSGMAENGKEVRVQPRNNSPVIGDLCLQCNKRPIEIVKDRDEIYQLMSGDLNVIVYEQAHHRGGAATAVCVGLVTEVLAFSAEHDIETMPVHTASLKKFAAGSGRASKTDMIEAAKARGWNPQDDNEADAQLLLEYGLSELCKY